MEKIKEASGKEKDTVIQTPKVLGILVEDRVATRIYRNNKKYGRKAKGYGRSNDQICFTHSRFRNQIDHNQ